MTHSYPVPMKYAQLERERRFLITDPSLVPASDQVVHITDHYITGTRLRLRVVDDPSADTIRKLGQKIRFDDSDPTSLAHTSLYLTEQEYEVLATLPASTLSKARTLVPVGPEDVAAIDHFDGALAGLVLAEIDVGGNGSFPPLPGWLGPEVSSVEAFAGQALSLLNAAQLAGLMESQATDRGI